jgi:hypothetical protein
MRTSSSRRSWKTSKKRCRGDVRLVGAGRPPYVFAVIRFVGAGRPPYVSVVGWAPRAHQTYASPRNVRQRTNAPAASA